MSLPTKNGSIRPARVAECQRLRAEGLKLREIADRMGLALTTVHTYLSDPDASKVHERKAGYGGVCKDCGASTSYRTGGPSERCKPCADRAQTIWTEETIIAAIRDFDARYGRPPTAVMWNPQLARARGRDDLAERFDSDACWPHTGSAQKVFGSWSAAIAAAGFPVLGPDRKPIAA